MKRLKLLVALSLICISASAHALVYDFNTVISGATPGGTPPYLRAAFTDATLNVNGVATSGVLLSLSAPGLAAHEFVTSWFFNSTLGEQISSLQFAGIFSGTALAKNNFFEASADDQNAGTGALYDLFFRFQSANNNPNRFQNGDMANIFLYGIDGLSEQDFFALSTANNSNKQYFAEAHIQGIDTGEGSGWVVPGNGGGEPVPEPGTMALLGSGLLGLIVYGKRRMGRQN